jgi:PAS domain S-box-containing protein
MNVPALMATYQLRQREYLLRITRAMTSRLDSPTLLRLILTSAAELVGCRAGLIVLEEEIGFGQLRTVTQYQIRASYNITAQALPAFEPLLDVAPLIRNEYDEDGAPYDTNIVDLQARVRQVEGKLGYTLGQVVGLPLLFEDELLGMIYLFRTEYAFTQLDWQFLQGFADQAAVAVRNSRLYHQLETERSRLATIVENSAHGILILDAERRVLVINQALAAMLGVTPQSCVGKGCQEVLNLQDVQGDDICQMENFTGFPNRESLHCEGDLQRPGGSRLTVSVTYTPLYDDEERLVNIIVNVHDITRFREEEEIKSTFTSIISHELKTPVALIKGYAQTLARPDAAWDAETARQSLQVIEEEADRLESLINNLLDVSRIQASGLRLDYADVNLERLARKVAEAYRTQTADHQLEVDFPASLPLVWGDEERLRQVLTNLVSNAIKYSPQGGLIRIGGWLEQPAEATDHARVVLYIADQGIGIPAADLPKIFDRFYRVDSSLRRSTAGAGLGLYLAKAIVEAHGGELWAHSEPGKGTTFFIGLPVEQGHEETTVGAVRQ